MTEAPRQFNTDSLISKSPDAITAWFEQYADRVYGFVYYRVGCDQNRTADVVQDTFLEALQRINEFDPNRGSMAAWLTTLSRNHMTRIMKQAGLTQQNKRKPLLERDLRYIQRV